MTITIGRQRFEPSFASGTDQQHVEMLLDLLELWASKLKLNRIRYKYYEGKNRLKDFGISTPPKLRNTDVTVCWPRKAVDALAIRSRLDGVSATDEGVQAIVDGVAERSRLKVRYRQGTSSQLIYACSFPVVTTDERGLSYIDSYSAERAAARWDEALGRVAYGMAIHDLGDKDVPLDISLFTDEGRARFTMTPAGYYAYDFEESGLGRCAMDAFAYRASDRQPFGHSRITRSVMSLTDSAVRVALGGDISYQFSVAPQKYLISDNSDVFDGMSKWEAYVGSILAVSSDGITGDKPSFGQLPQGSMTQTVDYFRLLAERFSMETGIPVSELGVVHDQPASGDAIRAASEPLLIEAEDLNDANRETLKTILRMAVAAELDKPVADLTAQESAITPTFRSPAMPSLAAVADAMVKVAGVIPGFAETDVFLEQMGFAEDIVRRIESERARASALDFLTSLPPVDEAEE